MAEQEKQIVKKPTEGKENKRPPHLEEKNEVIVRILGQDIPGSKNLYVGLTHIKGVSWSIANVACIKLNLDRKKRIKDLDKKEIERIENFLKTLDTYVFLMNRRADFDTGDNRHLLGTDLDVRKEFDIKRLKKIKSYRGNRHALGQPVRGQSTRSHFRKSGVAVGVKKKAK